MIKPGVCDIFKLRIIYVKLGWGVGVVIYQFQQLKIKKKKTTYRTKQKLTRHSLNQCKEIKSSQKCML